VLVSVLAAFAAAETSKSANPCSMSTTLTAASAVSQLNSCTTLDGQITIKGNEVAALDLGQVRTIKGDVTVFNSSSITSINLNALANVTGSLLLSALTTLNNVQFVLLTSGNKLSFVSLPSLASLNLGSGLANITSLTLSDTALGSIDKLLLFESIGVLNVNNNKNITSIDLSDLKTVNTGLTLSFNSAQATINLPNLVSAGNLTIQNVASLDISKLKFVNDSFVLGYNSFKSVTFDSFSFAGASLQVFANNALTTLKMPNLTKIDGELRVFNNSLLRNVDISNLETVEGAVSLIGDFGNLDWANLKSIKGDFSLAASARNFSCSQYDMLQSNNKIRGFKYNCSSPTSTSLASRSGSSTATGHSSSSSGSSKDPSSSPKKSGAAYLSPGMLISVAMSAAIAVI
ncbi:hypothetical protein METBISCDRAFT_10171, partial [Metschnikowia bicuspidata]